MTAAAADAVKRTPSYVTSRLSASGATDLHLVPRYHAVNDQKTTVDRSACLTDCPAVRKSRNGKASAVVHQYLVS